MAEQLSLSEVNLTCPICCDIFTTPVALKCSHSFCQECLQTYWKDLKVLLCPVCRKECLTDEPTPSLAFKSLCESFKRVNQASGQNQDFGICSLHGEKCKLFCHEEKQLICVVCQVSKQHEHHKCSPVQEAAEDLKVNLKTGIETLEENLLVLTNAKKQNEEDSNVVKNHIEAMEQEVRNEFRRFHQFLHDKEAKWITSLRQQQEQKCCVVDKTIAKLEQQITSLSETIKKMKQESEEEDATFLKNYNNNYERIQTSAVDTVAPVQKLSCEDITLPGSLFAVWAEMQDLIQEPPVTLDPLTASKRLFVSQDCTTVQYTTQKLLVPDNPERFYVGVMGSQGFNSGVHCWDVGVGDSEKWTIGVVEDTVDRKKLLVMEPQARFWSIRLSDGVYRLGVRAQTEIIVKEDPWIIRVWLDYDQGRIRFCDPHRNNTLCTYSCKFKEKIFPYFCSGSTDFPLTLFPGKMK
ncbi:E3 ubiquitin-protein ligase TRIM39-like [Engraulis encrasicolus]|uniref:E3 ubiquitin-protein ligase TRIM39-like n=1 Tax=Engraulis encrasicolus TaxID=184585 RepID=UPI002FD56407